MSFWPVVKFVINEADIVLLVVDARMPDASRNEVLEKIVEKKNKKLLIVFNKIDLIDEKTLRALKKSHPFSFFVSGSRNIGLRKLKKSLYVLAKKMNLEEPKIGFVGYPNVGKSSVINALAKRARAKVSGVAGTTRGVQWIKVGKLKILDSPGVIPVEDKASKLSLIGAKNPEKLKYPILSAYHLIRKFIEEGKQKSLEEKYKIKIEGDNLQDVLISIGKKRGFLKKGGIVDENRTAIQLLRDWQSGEIVF